MCLHLHNELASQGKDSFKSAGRFERREREKKIGEPMTLRQDAVHDLPIEPVSEALLSRLEGEVSPYDGSGWQESPQQNIGAKVHVMMAVKTHRRRSIEATELVNLG